MSDNIIFNNEYIRIFHENNNIFVESFKKGMPPEQLSSILSDHPEIGVISMTALRNAINIAPKAPEKFGEFRKKINIEFSENELLATIVYYLSNEALDIGNRENLIKETMAVLNENGIVHGINNHLFSGDLVSGKSYIIASGEAAVNGEDSKVNLFQFHVAKPEVREDGTIDFYELKLINNVKAGEWLGERIEATEGTPGMTVKGKIINPVKGYTTPLNYEKNSVQEVYENNKTTLYSKKNGVVNYINGKLDVSNHLEITGDVGMSTGNITFDGHLTIKGTVSDGFSVVATDDIEINGELGVGSVKSITSTNGSIYIKGGISAKSHVEIKASKNIYIKFVDNANIISGGIVHIGYYCLNSNIIAKEVIMDASNAKIIGGHIKAEIKVSAPIIGSEIEKKTMIEITGFDRQTMLQNLDNIFRKISDLKNEQQKLKIFVTSVDVKQLDNFKKKEYNEANDRLFLIREEIKNLEEERKNIAEYLKAHGEGEITAAKRIYPHCTLSLNKNIIDVNTILQAPTFFLQDGLIKQI